MATLITSKPSMMAFPSALNRMGTFPIDISSVWYSYEDAVAYATQTNFEPTYEGQTGLPYVGQILTVVETAEDGTTSVTAYSIQNEAGDLARVGTVTLGDDASIVRDEETGVLALNGFADAEEGEFAVVGADGKLTWQKIAADEATITNDEGKMALYGIKDLTWKDGEGEDAADVAVYQPKLVKKDGKVVLTWEIPSAVTVEGLDTRLKTAEEGIKANADAIKVINETTVPGLVEDIRVINEVTIPGVVEDLGGVEDRVEVLEGAVETINETTIPALEDAIEAVATDLADNYYDKGEVDAKLTSVFKFQGVKTYKSELPTTGQKVGDVWLVIYDGDAPAEGEANTLPVSNTEYVWTTENKWEDLGDDLVDLTSYYTKSEVDGIIDGVEEAIADLDEAVQDELAKKGTVSDVTNGTSDWSVTVSYADGTEASQAAIKTVLAGTDAGLVKNGGVATIADGVITAVSEAGHAAEATHATKATNADDALRAVDATNAVNAQNAEEASHALEADEADHAASADEATHAGSADTATRATDADHADAATKVNHKLTVIGKEFDGSADVSVTADEVKTAINLDNYYTKGEADNNFMTETETNNAITAVTDPLAEAIKAIKGNVPEEEGYVLPNLVNVGARLDAHDEAIEGLGTQVETANNTANAANATAGEAKTIAGEAKEAATSANTTAGEAKTLAEGANTTAGEAKTAAEGAVSTANAASGVANEAKTKAEEAVGTANTAKGTADNALAKAGANETAIKALQEKDTTIEGLVNTNTTNITNLTNTVTTGLADRYTKAETNAYVAEQIAAIDHLKREVVESLPGTPDANTIYMVPREEKITKTVFNDFLAYDSSFNVLSSTYGASSLTVGQKYRILVNDEFLGEGTAVIDEDGYSVRIDVIPEECYISDSAGTMVLGGIYASIHTDGAQLTIITEDYPENNIYVEWMYINQKWERLGTTSTDLVKYLTKDGAIDNTTISGVKTAEVIANAAKTAEWEQISGKPTGNFVNKVELTISAGQTETYYQIDGLNNTLVSYKAYIENINDTSWDEVIIDYTFNPVYESRHFFKIASAISQDIKIIAYFA